ncbi:hypothetical protein F5X68DRAFT_262195 [Plectosphaerella plurivora]|uniref:Phospholipase/carboxylesterase/thioesterase domain-containing protein n=1 Tax=Plectosphaerella plurivora TaxID=936078 RepID=A0A9P8VBS1_9PEZI|nr:hypothetical protein F5X68DRAFT_262195 [Plectosphaerella plurivora]
MPPRVPTEADFTPLRSSLTFTLTWPKPAELTTSFLIILHGLGDSEGPLTQFASAMNLPGVLCITIRGVSPLPSALLGFDAEDTPPGAAHFHWGDDLKIDPSSEELDPDPGFTSARTAVIDRLVRDTLVARCGWSTKDVMLFGFGQGGSLALGLASELRLGKKVEEVTSGASAAVETLKGVVSIGGPLPRSMVPSLSARPKAETKVLVVQMEDDDADFVKEEFEDVRVVKWKRKDVAMPSNRDEMLPIMQFFASRLNSGW